MSSVPSPSRHSEVVGQVALPAPSDVVVCHAPVPPAGFVDVDSPEPTAMHRPAPAHATVSKLPTG
jgi:hypothetical protein